MFQYTTETIINSNNGNLASGKRFEVIDLEGVKTLLVDGVNAFRGENITAAYKSEARKAKEATATITLPITATVTAGDVLRLTVTLSETGRASSIMQNAYLHNSKPFHYEVVSTGTLADDMKELAKIVKKDLALTDFKFFEISEDGLTLKAKDCYVQFEAVKLGKVVAPSVPGGYAADTVEELLTKENVKITLGDQGAGTVARIVKDLRIPTNAAINPFAADQGGRPIPGKLYDQYLIEYTTTRRHVSGTVVGSVNTSITSHVFFVEQSISSDFETAITTANGDITVKKAGQGNGGTKIKEGMGSVE